jgi:hypothetical protein
LPQVQRSMSVASAESCRCSPPLNLLYVKDNHVVDAEGKDPVVYSAVIVPEARKIAAFPERLQKTGGGAAIYIDTNVGIRYCIDVDIGVDKRLRYA